MEEIEQTKECFNETYKFKLSIVLDGNVTNCKIEGYCENNDPKKPVINYIYDDDEEEVDQDLLSVKDKRYISEFKDEI